MRFAELLARSCFSFLEGSSHPEEMVETAQARGLEAIALCDRDGIYGMARAYSQGKKLGQRVIVGAELTLEVGFGGDTPRPGGSIALLAIDHDGYSNLCHLLTESHADHDKGEAGITIAEIATSTGGLFAVVPIQGEAAWIDAVLGPAREAFGDRLVVATWRHLDGRDRERTAAAIAASRRHGVPIVASARPLYHHPSRKPLADVMHCIRNKTTLDEAGTALAANTEAYLRSPEQILSLFRDHPEWVEETVRVADLCRFSMAELRYSFPSDTLCLEGETADEALRRGVYQGCEVRYPGGVPPAVRAQIEKELELIAKLDVAPYFLSVQQIVEIARARRILCQGRGSAANSAVCFALGITAVDPARSNLLFERFLSAERAEPPDIDVDFEHERREEVIQEIYARYGRDRAAMVSEIISYRGKSAIREVGKVFGLSLDQVERLSGTITHYDFEGTRERIAELGLDPDDERLRKVVLLAGSLEGFPRHLSIHVGGFVLSSEPLRAVAPVEPARMADRTVIPWDKDDVDDLGFFKVDVLGLGMLTAIRKCLAMVHDDAKGPFDPIEALAAIPPEDPEVYEAICHADTIGVFQIESRAQMAMLPRLRPKSFYDLVIEVAIVRPGPIQGGMVHPYLRRRTGQEAPESPHPCLDEILERTLGVPLFQEQVMQIAMTGAGYTPGEADQLRRDMAAWKKHGRLERHHGRLLEGFAKQGISARFGEQLYKQIHGFGEYGFPECVIGETLVLDASTGRRVRIEDVVAGRAKLKTTIACDSRLRLRKRKVLAATPSGPREVFRLRTALGRELCATAEHPLLTVNGWRPLALLGPGDHVAAARQLPSLGKRRWPRHEIVALADLVAEGQPLPAEAFELHAADVELLLAQLRQGKDGSYDTQSRLVAEQVQHLLLRLGIVSSVVDPHPEQSDVFRLELRDEPTPDDADACDVYWDQVVSVERVGVRETYDLTIEGDPNFLANDFIVHNSHAASFALLVYASAWLKVHHPAAFACALLNSQPMGFYSPSSIVRDAQNHGVTVRPVCVVASDWDNLLERDDVAHPALRLGMRQVKGMAEAAAKAIEVARRDAPFTDLNDLVRRAQLKKNEIEALAEAGALEALVPQRREALWRARAPRVEGLFEGMPIEADVDVGLPQLQKVEQLVLDYHRVGLSIHDHPMKHLRASMELRGARRASDLLAMKHGDRVTVAGLVIGRQRPATASGVTFVTLEDETGIMNLVVQKQVFAEQFMVARHSKLMLVRGRVEREGEVIHILVRQMERLDLPQGEQLQARSRDFH